MGSMYSAPDIYHRIRGGRGSSAFSSNGAITEEQSNLQSSLNDQITQLNQKMNQAWQGVASQQAISGAAPLASAADQASVKLATASQAMTSQVNSFHTAYNSVVPMNSTPPANNIVNEMVSGLGINTPLDQQISGYNAAGQHNVQVYNSYSAQSAANASEMPTSFDLLPNPHPTISVVSPTTGYSSGPTFTGSSGPGGSGSTPPSSYAPPSGPGRYAAPPTYGSTGPSGYAPAPQPPGGGGYAPPPPGGDQVLTPSAFDPGPGGPSGGPGGFAPFGYPGGQNGPGNEEFVGPGGYPGGQSGFPGEEQFNGPGGADGGGFGGGPGYGGPGGEFGGQGSGYGGSGGNRAGLGPSSGSSAQGGGTGSANAAGGATGEESAMGRAGMMGAPGGPGMAGPMMAGGRGGKGEEDKEHKTAEYLQEGDPDALFGYDQQTVPPVIE